MLGRQANEDFNLRDFAEIVNTKRSEAHKCYKKNIGDINSHGLLLLHGPVMYKFICCRIHFNTDLVRQETFSSHLHKDFHLERSNSLFLGTLLFGDTSLHPLNNPLEFPENFRRKFDKVHVVQVPHHGSSKNWHSNNYIDLNIGGAFRGEKRFVSVCNFGYENKFGHPSHQVLDELRDTIYLNSQFSSLEIFYDILD